MFFINPFLISSSEAKGKILSTLPWNVGRVMLMVSVCVFWEWVAVIDMFTCGTVLKVFEKETEELSVLFKAEPTLDWFKDCW
ncbi:hypothetical protein D9M72_435340 [compost metagenome]